MAIVGFLIFSSSLTRPESIGSSCLHHSEAGSYSAVTLTPRPLEYTGGGERRMAVQIQTNPYK